MGRTWWAWARLAGGAAILIALVRTLGTGPFADGVRTLDGWSVAAAAGIAVVTTVCCAWRWSLVARGLGVAVPLPAAVAAYYRSQFVNTALPGGVLGDLHRGVAHGRSAGDVGRGLRAVGWERLAGQLVQAGLAVLVLLALPSPVRAAMPAVLAGLAAAVLLAVLAGKVRPSGRRSRWARAVGADLRSLVARRAWPGIVAASVVVVAGHAATFLIAARAAGVTAPPDRLLPLALLALLGMAVPANIGGWGPREGVTAWLFGAAGLGAAQGLATAVAYGVLVLVASLPGALVLIAGWASARRAGTPARRANTPAPGTGTAARRSAAATRGGAAGG
ncbi:lysylphosphatidylglycerol synthase domain-containing protein [Jatrophihabitans sp.]|uniref:lysylphosphatidylglycerol synthase domain-containing protein n=1 Tax=Jatrophihabitans sp. TaxID=1932789 RepID=UPI002CB7DA58|nr:lysylphosphatidylglycerol synthase domain-containing protein [Jatrophihabitans sp.]